MNLFVSAIPRSGTNYVTYFLFFLHSILVKMIDGRGVDAPFPVPPIAEYRHLGMQVLAIAHASLDEKFMPFPDDAAQGNWRALKFYHRLYNDFKFRRDEDAVVRDFIRARGSVNLADAASRHVFLYRNILDQMTSFYFHLKNHSRADAWGYTDEAGAFREIADIGDFLRNGAVESYLKYYLSYHWAAQKYRSRILFLSYEEMMAAPKYAFRELLRFADAGIDLDAMDQAIDMALQFSAPENLKNLEREQGKTLPTIRRSARATHMRDGGTCVWKKHLGDDDLDYVEEKLNRFGLSLSDFRIEP